MFGGTSEMSGLPSNPYSIYLSQYNSLASQFSDFDVNTDVLTVGSDILVDMSITISSSLGSYTNNEVVFIVTYEQDEDYFSSVVYYQTEDLSSFTEVGESREITHTIPIYDSYWNIEDIEVVTLIQSKSASKKILYANSSSVGLENMLNLNVAQSDYSFVPVLSQPETSDMDYVANPGEQGLFAIDLQNNSINLEATNINATLVSNSDIEVSSDSGISIDNLDLYEDVIFEFPIQIPVDIELGAYSFIFSLTADYVDLLGNSFVYDRTYEVVLDVSLNQQGWPLTLVSEDGNIIGMEVKSSPAIADLDGNGNRAMFGTGSSGKFYIYSGVDCSQSINCEPSIDDSSFLYPTPDAGDDIWGSPSVGDIDLDGEIEIVFGSKDKHLYVVTGNEEKLDFNAGQFVMGSPALGNLDSDDDLEIVFGGYSSGAKLFAINLDGSSVEGFPITVGEKMLKGPALADFNGNGVDDIVIGTDSDKLYLFFDDGSTAPGFPLDLGDKIQSAPSVLNYNGTNHIYVGCNNGNFYAISETGQIEFIIPTGGDIEVSPSISKIHETVYIYFASEDGNIYRTDMSGNFESFSIGSSVISSLVHVDLNGNSVAETVAADASGLLHAFDFDWNYYPSFPIVNEVSFSSGPSISKPSDANDLNILVGSISGVTNIDVKEEGSIEGAWLSNRGNYKRNGYIEFQGPEICVSGDVNSDGIVDILDIVQSIGIIMDTIFPTPLQSCAADLNSDGIIDILDIVSLVSVIMNG